MTKQLFILREIKDFASGAFENTAVENGGIRLGRRGSGHLPAGSYTTPPLTSEVFTEVVPSWNADTPRGTTVEVQARVSARGQWSEWFSFGRWSPFILRASPEISRDEMAQCDAEFLTVLPGRPAAEMVQLRVHLATEDPAVSPTVRLLAVSVNADVGREKGADEPERVLETPAYSCLVRDPAIAGWMAGATSLAMLMNRHGEDLLPEEVARAVYDKGAGKYSNLSFLCAVAGAYGYECYASFAGVETLWREVWCGNPVGALVRYHAPALSPVEGAEEGDAPRRPADLPGEAPVLEGATVDSSGHIAVVRGLEKRGRETWVLLNDPLAPDDAATRREIPLARFEEIYAGLCLVLHKGPNGAGAAKPVREMAQLALEEGEIRLVLRGQQMVPGPFTREDYTRSTLCYTVSGPVLYASAAQRKFYYPYPDENGALHFDAGGAHNRRLVFYRIGPLADTVVGEKAIPPEDE